MCYRKASGLMMSDGRGFWAAFDEKGATLSMAYLREMFPDEEVLYEENQRVKQKGASR